MSEPNSIVRLQLHGNRTPTGRPSATATRKLAQYLAYGRGRPAQQAQRSPRGVWYTERGQIHSHEEVLAWVLAQGKSQAYTYQLILSVNEVTLAAAEYLPAMTAGGALFPEWRLISHRDTGHSHAHVLAFGDEEIRVTGRPFRDWWQAARLELTRQQELALQAGQREAALGLELGTNLGSQHATPQQVLDWEWEV